MKKFMIFFKNPGKSTVVCPILKLLIFKPATYNCPSPFTPKLTSTSVEKVPEGDAEPLINLFNFA